ncbi:MAG: DNA-3-methyladenine glycosylase [Cellulosilyticaceae bacterium]
MEGTGEDKVLPKAFYLQDGLKCAKALLGMTLVRKIDGIEALFKIVETEAYMAPEDKACHAYGNKVTPRTKTMFLEGGVAYIYLIYGMYNCLNIVSNEKGIAHAVLIRAVEPLNEFAWEICRNNRQIKSAKVEDLTNGPGKLCKALAIDKHLNEHTLLEEGPLYLIEGEKPEKILSTKRINIDYAEEYKDKLWRFYIEGNPFVSKVKIK